MITFDQFLGLLRSSLLDTRGAEVVLSPYMLTTCLVMSQKDWQLFAESSLNRLQFDVNLEALSGSSTILDLYFASLPGLPCRLTPAVLGARGQALVTAMPSAYIH